MNDGKVAIQGNQIHTLNNKMNFPSSEPQFWFKNDGKVAIQGNHGHTPGHKINFPATDFQFQSKMMAWWP